MGYDNPYYHNHDPDVNAVVDEEWFQGRDEEVLETSSSMPPLSSTVRDIYSFDKTISK